MLLVRVRRLLKLEQIIQVSFAEYHSKRNPVERVHAAHTKEQEKHGPFQVHELHIDSEEHKSKMGEMREEVQGVLQVAKFGGEHTMVMKGSEGEENYMFNDVEYLQKFLRMNEDKKGKCEMTYSTCQTRTRQFLPTYNPGQNVWDAVPFSRIAAIFTRSPLPPDAMLDNSSASLSLWKHCMGGRGEGRIWPKERLFPCEKLIDGRGSAFCKLVPHN